MSDDVPEGWVADAGNSVVYHTNQDCPSWPGEVRELTDLDLRRNVRECTWCARQHVESLNDGE